MNLEFSYPIYYIVLLLVSVFLSKFLFIRYLGFAKMFQLTKSTNSRTAHKGTVYTGAGIVFSAVIALCKDELSLS